MTHGSLFSGIGGFDLAAEWMGWDNIFHCEWNEFGQKVLKHYWPKAISYHDITKTDFTIHRGRIDILTGGFPCQPYSMAGKRKGKEDERHLWPEMLRAIKEIQPRWVVGENVYGLVNWSGGLVFHEVQTDLEAEGYEVFPYVLPAAAVNAPHRRDRVWFVAYADSKGSKRRSEGSKREWKESYEWSGIRSGIARSSEERIAPHPNGNGLNGSDCQHEINASEGGEYAQRNFEQMGRDVADTLCDGSKQSRERGQSEQLNENGIKGGIIANTKSIGQRNALENGELGRKRFKQSNQRNAWDSFPSQSPICTGDDGLSSRLDGITFSKWRNESIKAAGNAIVPQVCLMIFKTIQQYEALPRMADKI